MTLRVLGYLFGVSDSTAERAVDRCQPLQEAAGRDTMRLPDPGRRKGLSTLLKDMPDVAVVIDTFEQAVQRPRASAECVAQTFPMHAGAFRVGAVLPEG